MMRERSAEHGRRRRSDITIRCAWRLTGTRQGSARDRTHYFTVDRDDLQIRWLLEGQRSHGVSQEKFLAASTRVCPDGVRLYSTWGVEG
jgi:hypothetical protein